MQVLEPRACHCSGECIFEVEFFAACSMFQSFWDIEIGVKVESEFPNSSFLCISRIEAVDFVDRRKHDFKTPNVLFNNLDALVQ